MRTFYLKIFFKTLFISSRRIPLSRYIFSILWSLVVKHVKTVFHSVTGSTCVVVFDSEISFSCSMYVHLKCYEYPFTGSSTSDINGCNFSLISGLLCIRLENFLLLHSTSFMLTHAIILIYRSTNRGPTVAIIESPNVQLLKSVVKVLDDFPCLNILYDAHHSQYQVVCLAIAS